MIVCYIGLFPTERMLHHFRMTLIDFLNGLQCGNSNSTLQNVSYYDVLDLYRHINTITY